MTPEQIKLIVDETERRFRSRTPSRSVIDVAPSYRVTRSEMVGFARTSGFDLPIPGTNGGLPQPRGRRSCPGLQRLPGSRRNERRMTMTTAHHAIAILKSIATNGHRYMDVIYGPRAATIRQKIASEIHGEPLTKSDKRCQYGNLRAALVELVGASGNCIAAVDSSFQQLVDSSNTENPEVETGAGSVRRPSIEAAQKEAESHLPGDASAWSVKVMDEKEAK